MPDVTGECLKFFEFVPDNLEEFIQRCSTVEDWRPQFQLGLALFLVGLACIIVSALAISYMEWRNGNHRG